MQKNIFRSGNKIYSLKSTITKHETNMSSNTAPSPLVASASSANTSYPAYKAFNNVFNSSGDDSWNSVTGVTNAWVQIDYSAPRKVNAVVLKNRWLSNTVAFTTPYTSPKDFDILGSNDGVNFRLLKSERGLAKWENGEVKTFTLNIVANFRYYRVHILNGNNDSGNTAYNLVSLAEIEFLYVEALTELPDTKKDNFIGYGTDEKENQYFSLIYDSKKYVIQGGGISGEDDLLVRTKTLNRKPLSIVFK